MWQAGKSCSTQELEGAISAHLSRMQHVLGKKPIIVRKTGQEHRVSASLLHLLPYCQSFHYSHFYQYERNSQISMHLSNF